MTLLTICQDAAVEIGVDQPSTVIGNTQTQVVKMLRAANKAGVRLMRAFPWQALQAQQSFTADAGITQSHTLSSNMDRIIPETMWDRTTKNLIAGPITRVRANSLFGIDSTVTGAPQYWSWSGNVIEFWPGADGGESITYEAIDKRWALSGSKAKFTADSDAPVLDEELLTLGVIFEYLRGDGLPSDDAAHSYLSMFHTLADQDQPRAGVMVAADIFARGSRHHEGSPNVVTPARGSII